MLLRTLNYVKYQITWTGADVTVYQATPPPTGGVFPSLSYSTFQLTLKFQNQDSHLLIDNTDLKKNVIPT